MGAIIKIRCKSCKADWQCRAGFGMMHANLDSIADLYPKDMKKEIYESVTDEYPLFDFSYKLARCIYCRDIITVPVLLFEDGTKEYVGECPQCGRKVELIHDLSQTVCPICEKNTMQAEEIGQWD